MAVSSPVNVTIAVNLLVPSPHNPRRFHDPAAEHDLQRSLATNGQLVPILVRQPPHLKPQKGEPHRFELVGGERRWRAALALGLRDLAAVHLRHLDHDDEKAFETAVSDNVDRDSLDPIDETRAILRLLAYKLDDLPGWDTKIDPITQAAKVLRALARGSDKTRAATAERLETSLAELTDIVETVCREGAGLTPDSLVTNRLGLLSLPPDLQTAIQERRIHYTAAKALTKLDAATRAELLPLAGTLSVRALREAVRQRLDPKPTTTPEPTALTANLEATAEIKRLLTHVAGRAQIVERLGQKDRESVLELLRRLSHVLTDQAAETE